MKKYLPSVLIILSLFVFAFHERWSIMNQNIPEMTNTFIWHITQWVTFILFCAGSILFGFWFRDNYGTKSFYHDFGEIISIAIIGITVYVFTLHYLTIPFFYSVIK